MFTNDEVTKMINRYKLMDDIYDAAVAFSDIVDPYEHLDMKPKYEAMTDIMKELPSLETAKKMYMDFVKEDNEEGLSEHSDRTIAWFNVVLAIYFFDKNEKGEF